MKGKLAMVHKWHSLELGSCDYNDKNKQTKQQQQKKPDHPSIFNHHGLYGEDRVMGRMRCVEGTKGGESLLLLFSSESIDYS